MDTFLNKHDYLIYCVFKSNSNYDLSENTNINKNWKIGAGFPMNTDDKYANLNYIS